MEKNRVNWEHSSPPSTCQCPPSQPSPSTVPLETPWKRLRPEGLTISTLQELLFYSAKKMFPNIFFSLTGFFSLSGFPDSNMREVKIPPEPPEGGTNPQLWGSGVLWFCTAASRQQNLELKDLKQKVSNSCCPGCRQRVISVSERWDWASNKSL